MSMKYDFTTILNREGTGAIAVSKIPFDNAEIKEGFSKIPMWVADMNYATAPSVIEAIQQCPRSGSSSSMAGIFAVQNCTHPPAVLY